MTIEELDQPKVKAFASRIFDVLNYSSQAMFISIGYKTGLIGTMTGRPPSTSEQIAEAAGLNERYVREWLGGMVVSRIVDYDPARCTYVLPPEHAVVLTAADDTKMASHAQNVPVLLSIELALVECFRHGGGVPYSANQGFKFNVPVDESNADAKLLEATLPLAPGLVDRLQTGIDVGEIGCGDGHTTNVMAGAFPRSRFTGYDFSAEGIAAGQAEARKLGLSNVCFELQDVAELDRRDAFDLVTAFDAIHDQAKPRTVLKAIDAALRPGGTFFMADIRASSNLEENLGHPLGPYFYLWSVAHCMTVSLAQGGEGLGTMWGEQMTIEYLADAGFHDVTVRKPDDDWINSFYICTKQ